MDWKNNIKMAVLPKLTHRFSAIPIKIPTVLFTKMDKLILEFIQKSRDLQSLKKILNKVERLTLDDFKAYCKTIIIKVLW